MWSLAANCHMRPSLQPQNLPADVCSKTMVKLELHSLTGDMDCLVWPDHLSAAPPQQDSDVQSIFFSYYNSTTTCGLQRPQLSQCQLLFEKKLALFHHIHADVSLWGYKGNISIPPDHHRALHAAHCPRNTKCLALCKNLDLVPLSLGFPPSWLANNESWSRLFKKMVSPHSACIS